MTFVWLKMSLIKIFWLHPDFIWLSFEHNNHHMTSADYEAFYIFLSLKFLTNLGFWKGYSWLEILAWIKSCNLFSEGFNSDGIHLVSFLLVLAKRMKNFANAKRTDIGRVGGFSLDVLYLWEQSNCWGLPGTNYVGLPGSNSVEYWHMLYHSAISVSYNCLFKVSI